MNSTVNGDNGKIAYLDGWRGLAIILVLAFHFLEKPFSYIGAFGVFLFFALSGMLMSQMLFIKKMDLPTFFLRRFSRVIPTFWAFTACMIIYAATLQSARYDMPPSEIISTLVFLRTYLPVDLSIWAGKLPIGHFWSLNVEEHSYVFLALGALLLNKSAKRNLPLLFLFASLVIVIAANILYLISPPDSGSPWFVRTEAAAIGLLSSATYTLFRARKKFSMLDSVPGWILPPIFILAAALFMSMKMPLIWISVFLLAFIVNHLDTAPVLCQRLLSTKVMRWFGKCSFSIYLWQQPFYMLIERYPEYRYLLLLSALTVGSISFYGFENPIREAINRAWARRRQRSAQYAEILSNNSGTA